jgi:hypothetical protein
LRHFPSRPGTGNNIAAMSASRSRIEPLIIALAVLWSTPLAAGPPFLTDDPEPVPFRHYEAYVFGTAWGNHDARSATRAYMSLSRAESGAGRRAAGE